MPRFQRQKATFGGGEFDLGGYGICHLNMMPLVSAIPSVGLQVALDLVLVLSSLSCCKQAIGIQAPNIRSPSAKRRPLCCRRVLGKMHWSSTPDTHPPVPEMERPHEGQAGAIEHLRGEWGGVFMCCDAIDVCLERVFVASVYTENGWF